MRPMPHELPIPARWLDVLSDANARRLLSLIVEESSASERVRYSEARRRLGMPPQTFQRALLKLEDRGLVLLRAPREEGRQPVYLEPTSFGVLLAGFLQHMRQEFAKEARRHGLEKQVKAVAEAEA